MKTHKNQARAVSHPGLAIDDRRASALLAATFAAAFGVFLVFGAGFANSAALHEAAHDARHAFAFPCH